MSNLLICDLDNVVAVNLEREMRGRQFADSRFVPEESIIPSIVYADAWKKIFYSERGLYNPEWIALDVPIEGAIEAVAMLERRQYRTVFLTSRPESLRAATVSWLYNHNMIVSPWLAISPVRYEIVMKAPAFCQAPPNHTYTRVWKAGMVQTLYSLYGASEMIVVDDDVANLNEIGKWITSPQCRGFTSLAEAVEALREEKGQ